MKLSAGGIQIERISFPRLAWLLVAVVMFWHVSYVTSAPEHRDRVIGSDGAGYYVYLPAIFIYHDLQFNFCKEGNPKKVDFSAADHGLFMNSTADGKVMNKYFIGTSILMAPFFLVAYGVAPAFGFHMNGYSFPFQLAIALAGIFYVLLGLGQIRRLLVKKNIPEYVQAIVILLLFFGTNLYHYALVEPSMSHAYSFAMIACFLNQAHSIFHGQKKSAVLWTSVLLAIIILIRPVNGSVVFALPFLAGSWKNFMDGIRFSFRNYTRLGIGLGVFALLVFLQLLSYKTCSGSWFAYSYNGEHLDFLHPNFFNVLLSWRKGWLIYTPMMFFAIAGCFFLRTNFERIACFGYILVNVWVISSWSTWPYGGSMGMRPMIDTYSVMAIPLAFFAAAAFKRWWSLAAIPVFGFLVMLNLVQHYQYFMSILPYDQMTQERYTKIFLHTDPIFRFAFDPGVMHAHTIPENAVKQSSWIRTFEEDHNSDPSLSMWGVTTEKKFRGNYGVKLGEQELSAGLCVKYSDAVPDSLISKTWLHIKSKVFLVDEQTGPQMAISFRSGGTEYSWDGRPLFFNTPGINSWQDFEYWLKIPPPPDPDGEVCIFLLHSDKSVAYADDLEMEFWVEK